MDMHEKISAFAKALDVSSEYLVSRKEDEKEVTATSKSVAAGGFVGAFLLAKPFSFVGARQHAPGFPDLPATLLAPSSPQSLSPSSGHANTLRVFPTCRRLCWRLPPRKAFVLRQGTPTRLGFSWLAGVFVGAFLPAKPLSFVRARQHAPGFLDLPAALLAPSSPQSLCPSSRHANTLLVFPTRQIPVSRQLTSDTSYNTVSLSGTNNPYI